MSTRRSLGFIGFLALLTVGGTIYYFIYVHKPEMTIAPSASLNQFSPDPASLQSVPIVFTSRTNAASLTPESPEAEPYREPIDIPWAATEGRLIVEGDIPASLPALRIHVHSPHAPRTTQVWSPGDCRI